MCVLQRPVIVSRLGCCSPSKVTFCTSHSKTASGDYNGAWIASCHLSVILGPPACGSQPNGVAFDEGDLDDLVDWCNSVAQPTLIVIDTLAKVRSAKAKIKAAYDLDYQSIAGLQDIARQRGIAIVVIHHTRKADADDAFDTVSGTLGLTGAADAILVLQKRNGSFTLHARGRDIDESETALQFNKDTCRWTILGSAAEVPRSNERNRIISALTGAEAGLAIKEIMSLAELGSRSAVDMLLCRMVKDGEVERLGLGLYKLPNPERVDVG
jgi:AAA domain